MIQYLYRLLKEIKNPPLFLYHIFHYMNKAVPFTVAQYIAKNNFRKIILQRTNEVLIKTIDGSNQIVHPDTDILGDDIVFVGTPYPYAMEEYENPCLYIGSDIHNLNMLVCPLDVQSEHTQGVHLSDPCVLIEDGSIKCVYRETIYKDDFIYVRDVTANGTSAIVSDRRLLLSSKNEYILSPAVVIYENQLMMYHVSTDKHTSTLMMNSINKNTFEKIAHSVVDIINEPSGFYLWHIGIVASDGSKVLKKNDTMQGLFLYIKKDDSTTLKLFSAVGTFQKGWSIGEEIKIPETLNSIIKFPYKSCFNPQNGKIILSFRDKKNRNRIIEI